MPDHETITCNDLDEAIDHYTRELGYRLDMITPADEPREALLSVPTAVAGGLTAFAAENKEGRSVWLTTTNCGSQPPATAGGSDWVVGRAGMMYRDLVPGRLGGKVMASHIRIVDGGDVADTVHYHKIDFQLIYCLKGAIRAVYEDQGEPFWLRPGDCVLQPPEIRHRVLEAEAGSEVIEVTSPAEHQTWFDHDMRLPTEEIRTDRLFGGQRFAHHCSADSKWQPSDNEPSFSGTNIPGIRILSASAGDSRINIDSSEGIRLSILVDGSGIEASLNV